MGELTNNTYYAQELLNYITIIIKMYNNLLTIITNKNG